MNGSYKLTSQRYGVGYFAHVSADVDPAPESTVTCSPDVETYMPLNDAGREALRAGALYALADAGAYAHVVVTRALGTDVDTPPDALRYAAAHAVWDALGTEPRRPPWIDAGGIHFPGE